MNDESYSFHYRNLDSTLFYAEKALVASRDYDDGHAEALNNLAFYYTAKMDYGKAMLLLDSVETVTDNQVELLIADIQRMRLCQRKSENKNFYDYHEEAERRLRRIDEEKGMLSEHQKARYVYASTEFYIVTSTYYYYVGIERQSVDAISKIDEDGDIQKDTSQYLNYLYNIGAGGIISNGTQTHVSIREFEYLIRCYSIAQKHGYTFWQANSLQAMSEHLLIPSTRDSIIADNLPAMKFINVDAMPDSLLAGNFALRSLDLFTAFGDVYQIAGAYRTLASCYWQIDDYNSAIACLQNALDKDTAIRQAPDLVASIREQLSIVYSAVNDKQMSDYNRNIYLDLQEQTRQDRYYEARAGQLARSSMQLNWMIISVVIMIIVVLLLLFIFHRLRRHNDRKNTFASLLEPLQEWQKRYNKVLAQMEDRYEDINEAYSINVVHIVNNKKRNLEQRAKISLVNSIVPFIDRMLNEIKRLTTTSENPQTRRERYTYIAELTDKINDYNSVLTEWIQMRQGQLNMHIESFPLQRLFDIVAKGRMSFQLKGIQLVVEPTDASVKADKILTLFMINTIADNARKFTSEGGKVVISAMPTEQYVEISVADTGRGMSSGELSGLFERKVYNGHGFGLMNCRGIIDKYKKTSPIFSVCELSAESTLGKGSRFFFRLPKGVVRLLLVAVMLVAGFSVPTANAIGMVSRDSGRAVEASQADVVSASARATNESYKSKLYKSLAASFADSAYNCNINGNYRRTIEYADSCRFYLNKFYLLIHPRGKALMVKEAAASTNPAEIVWFRSGLPVDYHVIMSIRNESAVAALALHQWSLYRYNNKVYTQLFKEYSADSTLGQYCRMMQRSEANKNVAVAILVLLLLSIFPAYYFMYYRHIMYYRYCLERVKQINDILLSDSSAEDKLHEINPISIEGFPEELKEVVEKIKVALKDAQNKSQTSHTNIELAEDERRRAEYEDQKLYVSNSVLDNCLSTLKHETMYYPSRIRQLIDGTDDNLQSIGELAEYYKELYSILSGQAMRQIDGIKFVCKAFQVSEVLSRDEWNGEDFRLLGDKDMIGYLFDILRKQSGGKTLKVAAESRDNRYVVFRVAMPNMHLDAEECLQLFTPSKEHLPYLLCRQIARDNGESTNYRACGIEANLVDGEVVISVTLAKARSN